MHTLYAPRALLPDGWAADVLLSVDGDGTLSGVVPGADADAAESLAGPVVPGIPNLHSHAFQRGMAGLAERAAGDDTFWGWRDAMYRFLQAVGPDELEAIAEHLYVEMLEAGYTSVAEFHYLHLDPAGERYDDPAELARRIIAAARRAGIGLTLLPVLYRTAGFGGESPGEGQRRFVLAVDDYVGLARGLRADLAGDPDAAVGVAPHSLRAVPPDALAELCDAAEAMDGPVPVHIHAAEVEAEVEACLAWSGARPVEWLLDHAPVDGRWCVVHATHVDGDELRRLAGSGAVVGLCPTTEANLGDGLFPLPPYLDAGGRLGIGSDSHVSVSPVEELRWLEYGQRLSLERRAVAASEARPSPGGALVRACLDGGRRAVGRAVGRIAPGSRADLVVLDGDHVDFTAREGDDILDAWIFSGNRSAVREVRVGGRPVVREGRHPRAPETARAFREALRRIV